MRSYPVQENPEILWYKQTNRHTERYRSTLYYRCIIHKSSDLANLFKSISIYLCLSVCMYQRILLTASFNIVLLFSDDSVPGKFYNYFGGGYLAPPSQEKKLLAKNLFFTFSFKNLGSLNQRVKFD